MSRRRKQQSAGLKAKVALAAVKGDRTTSELAAKVRGTVEPVPLGSAAPPDPGHEDDPLAGVRASTGIADLAEHFDDYRFGRRRRGVGSD